MNNLANGGDKRQFGRRTSQLHAWIHVPGRPRLACLVSNVSVKGAELTFETAQTGLPYFFTLSIEASKFETACEMRHQRGTAIGVEFVADTALAHASETRDQGSAFGSARDWVGISGSRAGDATRRALENSRR